MKVYFSRQYAYGKVHSDPALLAAFKRFMECIRVENMTLPGTVNLLVVGERARCGCCVDRWLVTVELGNFVSDRKRIPLSTRLRDLRFGVGGFGSEWLLDQTRRETAALAPKT